jgi:hypothetical protein
VLADDARFVSLAEIIRSRPLAVQIGPTTVALVLERGAPETVEFSPPEPDSVLETRAVVEVARLPVAEPAGPETASAVRAARLFRAALADAFDALAAELAAALASDVLGRELQLSACDIASIARRLIAERCADEPLSVRVCPADAGFGCDLPIVADPQLRPGDAVLVCRNGEIDARLAVRFAHVVAAVAP